MEVEFHAFLICAVGGGECRDSSPSALRGRERLIEQQAGWVPSAVWIFFFSEIVNYLYPCRETNPAWVLQLMSC